MASEPTTHEGRRFDWVSRHDPRSRQYGISEHIYMAGQAGVVPRVQRWVPMGTPLDQGAEGSCVGHGCAHDLGGSPVRVKDMDHLYAVNLYQFARSIDRAEHGWNWPDGASVLAGAKALRARGFIGGFRWAFTIEDLRDALITTGPAILGVNWYDSMYETDPYGNVEVSGRIVGGHCIMVYGYNPRWRIKGQNGTHEIFRWQNSWGPSYGVNGRGVIKAEDLARLLAEDGEACIPIGRRIP
jgi:hypothetical protein